jgi:hypothetical protein
MAPQEGLSVERIADRSLVGVILAADHPLASHDVIPGSALSEHAGATFPREWNPEAWERVHAALTALGADLRTDEALTTLQAVLTAATTLGWWVPAPPAVAAWLPPSVAYRCVEGLDVSFVVEAVRRTADASPAADRFIQALYDAESRHGKSR